MKLHRHCAAVATAPAFRCAAPALTTERRPIATQLNRTMKYLFTLFAVLQFCPLATLHATDAAKPNTKPNILIFYVDDMGWAQPGCYGGETAPTPNIDALAAAGMRFTDGYSSGCICSPGRVGLMTG